MTAVSDFGEYTGIHGTVSIGGAPLADAEYDVRWERTTVSKPRAGKRSPINIPGSLKVTTTVKKALVRTDAPTVIGATLTDAPLTGTAGTLLAATEVMDGTDHYNPIASGNVTIATPSRVRLILQTKAMAAAGEATVIGENVAGIRIADTLDLEADMAIGDFVTTPRPYKKVFGVLVEGADTADDLGTLLVTSITGSTSYGVGDPLVFDLAGRVTKGAHVIEVVQPDCWFKGGGLNWSNGDSIVEVNLPVEMHDPDLLEVTET